MKQALKTLLYHLWKIVRPKRKATPLFLMGHPRSGSSLLMHILCSNSEIEGFGEYLTKYTSEKRFQLAEFDIRRKTQSWLRPVSYIANQVNHHSLTPNLELLNRQNSKLIILLRTPEETLSSIYLLSKKKEKPMTYEAIVKVYVERLESLRNLASEIPITHWTYTTYTSLTEHTSETLEKLTSFLGLAEKLTPAYNLQKFTQVWGDPSKHIRSGKIVKPQSELVPFADGLLAEAQEAYNQTLDFLDRSSR